ncbi:TPA: flippase [Photobacterium damselae]
MDKILRNNLLSMLSIQGLIYVAPLITLPYLVKVLGPICYGVYGFSLAIMNFLMLITDYGFNITAGKKASEKRDDKYFISHLYINILLAKLIILSIVIFVFIFISTIYTSDIINIYVISILAIGVLGNIFFPVWLFQAKEDMRYIAILNIISKISTIPLVFIFINSSNDLIKLAMITSFSFLLVGFLSSLLIIKKEWISFCKPSFNKIIFELKDGFDVFTSTASVSIYSVLVTFVLGLTTNPTNVGYFVAADRLRRALQGIAGAISQAFYPRITMLVKINRFSALELIKKLYLIQIIPMFLFSSLLFIFSDEIITLLYGVEYVKSIYVLKVLSFLPLICAINSVSGTNLLVPFGFKKYFSRNIIVSTIFGSLLIYPMTIWFKEDGAAYTCLITELIVFLFMSNTIYRMKKEIYEK